MKDSTKEFFQKSSEEFDEKVKTFLYSNPHHDWAAEKIDDFAKKRQTFNFLQSEELKRQVKEDLDPQLMKKYFNKYLPNMIGEKVTIEVTNVENVVVKSNGQDL